MAEKRRPQRLVQYGGEEPIIVVLESDQQYLFRPGGNRQPVESPDVDLFDQLQDFEIDSNVYGED